MSHKTVKMIALGMILLIWVNCSSDPEVECIGDVNCEQGYVCNDGFCIEELVSPDKSENNSESPDEERQYYCCLNDAYHECASADVAALCFTSLTPSGCIRTPSRDAECPNSQPEPEDLSQRTIGSLNEDERAQVCSIITDQSDECVVNGELQTRTRSVSYCMDLLRRVKSTCAHPVKDLQDCYRLDLCTEAVTSKCTLPSDCF